MVAERSYAMNFKPLQGKYSFLFRCDTLDEVVDKIVLIASKRIHLASTDEDISEEVGNVIYHFGLMGVVKNTNEAELTFIYERVSGDKIVPSFYTLYDKSICVGDEDKEWIDGYPDNLCIIDSNNKFERQFDDFEIIRTRLEDFMSGDDFDNAFPNYFDDLIDFLKPIIIYKIKGGK